MASTILAALGGEGIKDGLTGISSVINAIRGKNPEAAAKLSELVENHKADFALAELQVKAKTIDAVTAQTHDAAGIITAEANSQSWLARNVRPLCLLFWATIITTVVAVNLIGHYRDPKYVPMVVDDWVYKLTAIGFTGYVGARTWEKVKGAVTL